MNAAATAPKLKTPPLSTLLENYKVWVLAPYLETEDENLKYYYDFSQSIEEYKKVFKALGTEWKWQPVTVENFETIIGELRKQSSPKTPLVINLCDGDEINGTPGLSVIHALESQQLIYTGSNAHFYDITTSKIPMKIAFNEAGVATAPWEVIRDTDSQKGIFERLGTPLLIKPAISGGSMGISIRNVVHNETELLERLLQIQAGYRGWDLSSGGLFVEQFISGPEYTTFIVGSSDYPHQCIVYEPVERVFHPSLPEEEKFLSFDRLWEIYEEEQPMPNQANFYQYQSVSADVATVLKQLTLDAYIALGGQGYARIDIRKNAATGEYVLLEGNAQCGISEDEDFTSIGAILKVSNKSFTELVSEILKDAFIRNKIVA